ATPSACAKVKTSASHKTIHSNRSAPAGRLASQTRTTVHPLRLMELEKAKADPDRNALACYGLLRRDTKQILLRFVTGQPVSSVTIEFLSWSLDRFRLEGKKALLLIWDNAPGIFRSRSANGSKSITARQSALVRSD